MFVFWLRLSPLPDDAVLVLSKFKTFNLALMVHFFFISGENYWGGKRENAGCQDILLFNNVLKGSLKSELCRKDLKNAKYICSLFIRTENIV